MALLWSAAHHAHSRADTGAQSSAGVHRAGRIGPAGKRPGQAAQSSPWRVDADLTSHPGEILIVLFYFRVLSKQVGAHQGATSSYKSAATAKTGRLRRPVAPGFAPTNCIRVQRLVETCRGARARPGCSRRVRGMTTDYPRLPGWRAALPI